MGIQALEVQFWDGTTWTNQATLSESGCTLTRGTDGQSGLKPSGFMLELNNDDNRYDPTDPTSPLYGVAKRRVQVKLKVAGYALLVAEAAGFVPARTIDHVPGVNRGRASSALTAEGVLRRVLSWSTPLYSPLRQMISGRFASSLVGYWPAEGGRDSTQLTNAVAGGKPGGAAGVTFGTDESPGGSEGLVQLSTSTVMNGQFVPSSATGGWQVSVAYKLAAIPAPIGYLALMIWYTSDGRQWTLDVNDVAYRVTARNATTGVIEGTFGAGFAGAEPTQWVTFRVKTTVSGGLVQVETAWYPEGGAVLYGITNTFAGTTTGYLTRWRIAGNLNIDGGWVGHIYGVNGSATDLLAASVVRASNGYPGERAGTRFKRLCDQVGVAGTLIGAESDTALMGVQRAATFPDHLKEIIATEDALIVDSWGGLGLDMRTRRSRYGQTPVMTLAYPGDVSAYEKVVDDQGIKNVVTVSQAQGGEATAALTSGPLSTAPAPAGIGEEKEEIAVNVADEATLPDLAAWYLGQRTIDRARYPKITIDLVANPGLIPSAYQLDPGETILVTGLEREPVPLTVMSINERIGHATRLFELTCLPDDGYDVLKYDTTDRWGAATTTLAGAMTATATALPITSTDPGDRWLTTGMPFDIMVAGERMTLTAMTAAAGSGPYTQTGTVVRSVNGVVKAQLAGAVVQVANVARWGL